GQILGWMQALARRPRLVDIPSTRSRHGKGQREGAPLPSAMKDRFILLGTDGTKAHHATHVLCAVHDASAGDLASPVPIMLSRVTSADSLSSLQASAPAGRCGSTRWRISAVESHTLISLSG